MVTVWSDAFQSAGWTVKRSINLALWPHVVEEKCLKSGVLIQVGSNKKHKRRSFFWWRDDIFFSFWKPTPEYILGQHGSIANFGHEQTHIEQTTPHNTHKNVGDFITAWPRWAHQKSPSTIIPTCDFIFGLGALTPERTSRWFCSGCSVAQVGVGAVNQLNGLFRSPKIIHPF